MHNAAGGSLHRCVHNSNESSALFRREVEQPGAAARGRKWRISSAAEITGFSWLLSHQTLLTSLCVFSTCMTLPFHGEIFLFFFDLFIYFHFCVCHTLEASSTRSVFSHQILPTFYGLYTRGSGLQIIWSLSLRDLRSLMHLLRTQYEGSADFSACLKAAMVVAIGILLKKKIHFIHIIYS